MEDHMTMIDWHTLNAAEVPKWLVALLSTDENRQRQAKVKLSAYLQQHALALNIAGASYNQVLETDAPVLITAILLEMLKDGAVAQPHYIIELLEIVASYFEEPTLGQIQRERAVRIHELVLDEFNLYLDMLKHPDDKVRINILELLRHLPEKQAEIANTLMYHLKTNPISDEIEKLTIVTMLFQAIQAEEFAVDHLKRDFIEILSQYIELKETATLVARAAYYLILLQKDQVSQLVLDALIGVLKEASFTDPSSDLGLGNRWIDALLAYGVDQATPNLFAIFEQQTDEYVLIEIAATLLELHFGSGEVHAFYLLMFNQNDERHIFVSLGDNQGSTTKSQIQKHSNLQKDVLRQFINKDQLWSIKTNLFELYALPTTQAEMRKLI